MRYNPRMSPTLYQQMPPATSAPWSPSEAQAREFAFLAALAFDQNMRASAKYTLDLSNAALNGQPASSVPPAQLVGVIANTAENQQNQSNSGYYQIAQVGTFEAPQPSTVPVNANPVGAPIPYTSVYAALEPASEHYANGDKYEFDSRGKFQLTAQSAFGGNIQRWWSLVA